MRGSRWLLSTVFLGGQFWAAVPAWGEARTAGLKSDTLKSLIVANPDQNNLKPPTPSMTSVDGTPVEALPLTASRRRRIFADWGLKVRGRILGALRSKKRTASVSCDNKKCRSGQRQEALDQLAQSLERAPSFLKTDLVEELSWNRKFFHDHDNDWEDMEGETSANGDDDGSISEIAVHIDSPDDELQRALVHELAHVYYLDKKHDEVVKRFLDLRYGTPEIQGALKSIKNHIHDEIKARYRRPPDIVPLDLFVDGYVTDMLAKFHLPRRREGDIHGVENSQEYWAFSVEFYYVYRRPGQRAKLTSYLSEKEISYLQKLFEQGQPPNF